jgi:hypothetical protein
MEIDRDRESLSWMILLGLPFKKIRETTAKRARHHLTRDLQLSIYRLFGAKGSFMILRIVFPSESWVIENSQLGEVD